MKRSIETRSLPNLLVATLATLPSMSLIPSAPFPICGHGRQCGRCNREKILLRQGYGGTSVVVQAPTGSGKTYIFELLYPNLKTQAVFTVPTRAAPMRGHALHPNLPRSPIMHHKSLMICAFLIPL
jgi:RAD3-like DEAD/DEAH box helicase